METYHGQSSKDRDDSHLRVAQARVYGRGVEPIAAALGTVGRCEDAWKEEEEERKVPAVATTHDKEYGRLAAVALGITAGIS
jgi:hypothetical protein